MTKLKHTGVLKLAAVIIAVLIMHSEAFSESSQLRYAVSSINSVFSLYSASSGSKNQTHDALQIKCPENISTYTDINLCTADISNNLNFEVLKGTLSKLTWTMEGATEATSQANGINQIDHFIFNEGVTIIRYTAFDKDGNTVGCSFTVVVSDNQAPRMSPPKNISINCDERIPSPHSTLQAFLNAGGKATDNCSLNPVTFKLESEQKSNSVCPFTITRIYQISDWQGNKGKVNQFIIVEGIETPDTNEKIQVLTLKSGMADFTATQNGPWNDAATWGGAGTPTLNDNVTIPNGFTVTISAAAVCNDITNSGTLNGTGNTLQVFGNWNNNGIYNGGSNGVVEFTGTTSTTISGTTNFEDLKISKGSLSSTLTINGTTTVLSSGALTLNSGLISIPAGSSFSVNPASALTIPSIAGFDLTGGTLTTGNFTITNTGLIRVSSGTANFGSSTGNSVHTQFDGAFIVTGGNVNITGRLENSAAGTLNPPGVASGIAISGGTVTLATVGNGLTNKGSLDVTPNGVFNFTGGNIVFQRESTATTALDLALISGGGTKTTIGGTFQFGNASTPAGTIFNISSNIPLNSISSFPNADLKLINDVTIGNLALNANSTIDLSGNSIRLSTAALTSYTFPLDNGIGVSIPVTINLTGGTFGSNPYFEIETVGTDHVNNASAINYLKRYWTVTINGITNPVYNITATYADADISGTETEIAMGSWSGSLPWVKYTPANTSSNTVEATGIIANNLVFAGITLDLPTVTISANNSSICIGTSTTLTANPVGDPTFTYSWVSNPLGFTAGNVINVTVNPTSTTTYTVTVTDGNGFPAQASLDITVDPASVGGNIAGSTTVCSGTNSSTLTLSGYTGDILNWEYSTNGGSTWSNISNTNPTFTATNLSQTTIYRAVVQSGVCTEVNSDEATVTVDPVSEGGTIAGGSTICSGSTSGLLTLSGQNGTVVKWQSSISPFSTWTDISNTAITYTSGALTQSTQFRAIVQSGVCPVAYSVATTVTVTTPITAIDEITDPIKCFGGTAIIKITASGGTAPYTYSFPGKPNNQTGIFTFVTGSEAGIDYNWSVTDNLNCTPATGTIKVTEPTLFTASAAAADVNCNGGTTTVTLTASGGTSPYSYTFNGQPNTTGIFTNVVAGINIPWSVKDANNCGPVTGNLTINQPTPISISSATVSTPIQCFGETGTVTIVGSDGTAPYSYTFNGQINTTGVFSGVYAGNNLSFSISDANGCAPTFGTINVPQPAAMSASAVASPANCNGTATGSIDLTVNGGTAPYSFAWNNGAGTAEDPTNLAAGSYTVTITDAKSCSTTASATVTQPTALTASVSETVSIKCFEGTATIKITAAGGTGAKLYTFNSETNTTGTFTGITGGTSYTWSVSDDNLCSVSGNYSVVQPTEIVPGTTSSNSPICQGATLNLTTTIAAGGTPPYQYSWTGPNGFSANNSQNPTILNTTPAASGTYTVTVKDFNNCTKTATTEVIVNATTTMINPGNQSVCHNASTAAINFTGATSYTWTNNNTSIGLAASGIGNISAFTATNSGTTPVIATITVTPSGNGCTGTAQTFTITVNPRPTATVVPADAVFCHDASVHIEFGSNVTGTTFAWSVALNNVDNNGPDSGSGSSVTQTLEMRSPWTSPTAVYSGIPTSPAGCVGDPVTSTIEIAPWIVYGVFTVDGTADNATVCPGTNVQYDLTGQNGTNYRVRFTYEIDNPNIGLAAMSGNYFGTGNSDRDPVYGTVSFTATNSSSVPQTGKIVFIAVTYWEGSMEKICEMRSITKTITVDPFALSCTSDKVANTAAGQCYATLDPGNPVLTCATGATLTWAMTGATVATGNNNTGSKNFNTGETTVTYTATKPGSPAVIRNCSFTVTVTDNQPPAINNCTVPITTAMTAGECGAIVNFTAPTVTDNCGGSVTLIRTDGNGLISGSLFPVGVSTISYLATDAAGNTSTCSFDINVEQDDLPPVITLCPGNQAECAPAGNPFTKTGIDWNATATENCGTATLTYELSIATTGTGTSLNNVQFNVGTTTVTWTATDNVGNSSTCSFDVEVSQAPSITANPVNQTSCLNGSATFTIVATGTPLPTFQWRKDGIDISGETGSSLTINPVLATDAGSYDVVVTSLTCGTSLTSAPATLTPSTLPIITQQPANQTDCFGNDVEFTITVANGETPYSYVWETRPSSAGVWTAAGVNNSTLLISNIGTGNNITGAEFRVTVTDACGNSTVVSSTATLSVNQMDLKTLVSETVCQDGITTFTAATLGASPVSYVWQINGTPISNGGAYSGATTQTLTISNAQAVQAGTYSASAIFNISQPNNNGSGVTTCQPDFIEVGKLIFDEGPDVVASLSSQTICSGGAVTEIVLSDANNAPGTTYSWTRDNTTVLTGIAANGVGNTINGTLTSLDPTNSHTTIFTVTASTINGCTSTTEVSVTVADTEAPTIATCPEDIPVGADAGECGAIVNYIAPTFNDNCDGINLAGTFISGLASGDLFPLGTTTVIWEYTDAVGNGPATCSFVVTVTDNVAPTAVCQSITVQLDASGDATITAADIDNGSSDNCGPVTLSIDKTTFDCGDVGPNTVTLTVEDVNGNTATCNATVTIEDIIEPTAICKDITVQLDATGNVAITPADIDDGSGDNCGTVTLTASPTSFNCANVGSNTVVLTVTDENGGIKTCSATVTVEDNIAPTVICQNITIQLDATGNATISVDDIDNGSTDNCAIATRGLSKTDFTCADAGTNNVTLTVTDVNGNSELCTATVTIEDTEKPVALCKDITVQLDASGNATITAADIDNGSTDNCGTPSLAVDITTFDCTNIGPNTVTLTVTDGSGNSQTCTATVTVEDNIEPTALCKDITVQLDATGNVAITPADIDNGSGDNCGTVTLTTSPTSFNCANVGGKTVVLTVTDENGGIKTCSATVTVEDNIAPTVVCKDFTVQIDNSGNATISAADIDNNSTDNCAIATRTLSQTDFTCADAGTNNVTLTVTDVNGNSAFCTATVTVQDKEAPVANCQDIIVQLDASGSAIITAADINNFSTDNCGTPSLAVDITTFDCTNIGPNTVTLTVTDGSGNKNTCTATVTVKDDNFPIAISATPSQTNIACFGGTATVTIAVSGGVGTLTYTFDGVPNGTGIFNNITAGTYNWSVTNALGCGNTSGSYDVQQVGDLSAIVALTDVTCSSGADGTITVTNPVGGSGNYEYTNNGGSTWQSLNVFSGLIPGTYNIQMRDADFPSCLKILDANVVIYTLTADVAYTDVNCNGTNNGTITVTNALGGSGMYNYSINGGTSWNPNGTFTNLAPGTYNVQIQDANDIACIVELNNAVVISEPDVLTADISLTQIVCNGANNGVISVSNPQGGYGTYEISIDGSSWVPISSATPHTFNNLLPATYTIMIRDAAHVSCIINLAPSIITEPSVLSATVNYSNITCYNFNDGVINITAPLGGNGTYQVSINGTDWFDVSFAIPYAFNNLVPGTYTVQIRDAGQTSCVVTLTPDIVITEPPIVTVTDPGPQDFCNIVSTSPINLTGSPVGVVFDITGGTGIGLADQTGVTQIPSFATIPGTATITITPRANGCSGASVTSIFNVFPIPTADLPVNVAFCNNTMSDPFPLTGTPAGIVVFDIIGAPSIGIPNSTNVTAIPSFLPITGAATITIIPKVGNNCVGTPVSFPVTVRPTLTATISGGGNIVCRNSVPPTVTFNNPMALPVEILYNINGGADLSIDVAANSSFSIFTPTNNAGIFTYNLVGVKYQTSPDCSFNITGSAIITVLETPLASIAGTSIVCQDAASPLLTFTNPINSDVIVTYNVNGLNPATINVPALSTAPFPAPTSVAGTFVYNLVSAEFPGAPSCSNIITGSATVTVLPTPIVTITGDATVCKNAPTVNVTVTNPQTLPVRVIYTINNGTPVTTNIGAGLPLVISVNTANSGSFTYKITSIQYIAPSPSCINNVDISATVVVLTPPTAAISGTATVCLNDSQPLITFTNPQSLPVTVTYNINGVIQTPVDIAANSTASVSASTSTSNTFVYNLVSVVYQGGNSCINNITGSATITVKPVPTVSISGDATICQFSSPSPNITLTNPQALPVTVTYKINGGASQTKNVPASSTALIPVPTTALGNFLYELVSVQYQTVPNCPNTVTGNVTVNIIAAPTLTVSGTTTVCPNDPQPDITFTNPQALPITVIYNINGTVQPSVDINGNDFYTVSAPTTTSGIYNYNVVSVAYQGGTACINTTSGAFAIITVKNAPAMPVAGNNGPVCVGSPLSLTANTIAGATYNWTGPNGFTSSAQNPIVSANATTAMVGIYSVTATGNGCTGLAGTTTVSVVDLPAAPTAGNNGPICGGTTLSLTASNIAGATYSWSGPNGFTSVEQNPTVSTNATMAMAGNYIVTAIINGCSGTPANTVVSIKPVPVIPNQITSSCNSIAFIVSPENGVPLGTLVPVGTTYSWAAPTGSGFTGGSAQSNQTSIGQTLTLTNSTVGATATYTVMPFFDGCNGESFTVTVNVNPNPPYSLNSTFHQQHINDPEYDYLRKCNGEMVYNPQDNDLEVFYWQNGAWRYPSGGEFNNVNWEWQYSLVGPNGPWIDASTVATEPVTVYYEYKLPFPENSPFSPEGNYYFRFIIISDEGCIASTDVLHLEVVSDLEIDAGGFDLVTCSSSPTPIPLSGASVTSRTGSYACAEWEITSLEPANSLSGSLSNTNCIVNPASVTYTPPANYYGTVTLTLTSNDPDDNGVCLPISDTRIITISPLAGAFAGNPESICAGGSIQLSGSVYGTATGGTWTAPSGTFSNENSLISTYTPGILSGTVTLTLTPNVSGDCVTASTVDISVSPAAQTTGVIICAGGSGSLSASGCPSQTGISWGPIYPTIGVTSGGNGTGWNNPHLVSKPDGNNTTVSGRGLEFSEYLYASDFGFNIPAGAIINGIQVTIGRYRSGNRTGEIRDNVVSLRKGGATIGDNNATTTNWPTSQGQANYGSNNNLWGATWTYSDINASDFGVALRVSNTSNSNSKTANVDYIRVTITYSINGVINWYTSTNTTTPIATGPNFNPVGVSGSGLPNTNTPGTTTFLVECTTYPGCLIPTDFVINPKPTVTKPNDKTVSACDYTDQAALDAAFANWLSEFSISGGTTPVATFAGTPAAPVLCTGGAVTVTYNYTDDCESGAESAIFTVDLPPALTLNNPGDVNSLSCDYTNQAAVQTAFSNWLAGFIPTGGCAPIGTFTGVAPVAPPICGGSVSVNYNVTDLCGGGTETATFTIDGTSDVVIDKPAPRIASSCDFTDQTALDADFATWLTGFAVVSGGCAGSASYGFPSAPLLCTGGTTEVTYLYQDVCSTVPVTESYTINLPAEIIINTPADPLVDICSFADQAAVDAAFATWLTGFSASGGCGSGSGSFSTTTAPVLCDGGKVDVTYTYTDLCESKSETASFTLDNTNALVVNKPANVDDEACYYGSQQDLNTVFADWLTGFNITGGCSVSGSYGTPSAPDLCAGGTTSVTYTVTDNCENTTDATATFKINKPGDLTFVKPAPFTATPCNYIDQNALNTAFQNWLTGFGVSGGCNPVGTYGNPIAPNLCAGGAVTVNYEATDLCVTTSVSETFTVEAVEPIQAVQMEEYFAAPCLSQAEMDAEFAAWIATFEYTGGCNVHPPSLEVFTAPSSCGGSVVVNYTFYDDCGQAANGSAVFTVEPDLEDPVITCPANFTGITIDNGSCLATLVLTPATATDNCSDFGAITITSNAPAQFPIGTTIVIWTATDICGNSSTCPQSITVLDNDEAPVITNCPEDAEDLLVGVGCYMITGEITEPTITDNCPDPVLHYDIVYPDGSTASGIGSVSGLAFPVGVSTVTYIAIDDAGNPSLPCEFTVWIKDNVDPVFDVACPITSYTVNAAAGECDAFVSVPGPSVSDPCDELVTLSNSHTPSTSNADGTYPVGTTTVIWTATDLSGNTTICEQDIIVKDVTAPTITCPEDVSGFSNDAECVATGVNLGTPTVSDDCSLPVTYANDAPTDFPVGNTTVTWTATDASGNSATCTQIVTITDNNQPPVFTLCPPDQIQTTTANNCELIDIIIPDPEYTDNCGVTVLIWTIVDPDGTPRSSNPTGINFITGETFFVGVSTVTYIAYDAAGNQSVPCTFEVWIKDFVKPEFTAGCPPDVGPVPTDAGLCTANITVPAPEVEDPCNEGFTLTNSITGTNNASGIYPIGETTVTWTIVDASGNITTCDQIITVVDSHILAVDCPAGITRSVIPGDNFVSGIVVGIPTTHLNCATAELTWVMVPPVDNSVFPVVDYATMYTSAELAGDDIFVGTGTYYLGVTTVTYTLTDANGNTATCDFTITITTAPEIQCTDYGPFDANSNCEYPFDPGVPALIQGIQPINWTWTITNPDGSTLTGGSRTPDDGPDPLPVVTSVPHEYNFQPGTTTIDWVATNAYGTGTCAQTIIVTDNTPPTFSQPALLENCVDMLISAKYSPGNQNPNIGVDPNMIKNQSPDVYTFRSGNTALDITGLSDNCCDPDDMIIHWSIDFSDTTNPLTPPAILTHPSISGTGQPSTYGSDILFPGDGVYFTTVTHTITYWIEDCHAVEHKTLTKTQDIVINPRPRIIKTAY